MLYNENNISDENYGNHVNKDNYYNNGRNSFRRNYNLNYKQQLNSDDKNFYDLASSSTVNQPSSHNQRHCYSNQNRHHYDSGSGSGNSYNDRQKQTIYSNNNSQQFFRNSSMGNFNGGFDNLNNYQQQSKRDNGQIEPYNCSLSCYNSVNKD